MNIEDAVNTSSNQHLINHLSTETSLSNGNVTKSRQRADYYNTKQLFAKHNHNKCEFLKNKTSQIKEKCLGNLKNKDFYVETAKKRIPILKWLPKYNLRTHLPSDVISGLTVGIMNIPQSMAYSILATLDPINGLYMSFFPLIIYALLGSSRHITVGPVAIVSLITGGVIDQIVRENHLTPLNINGTILTNSSDAEMEKRLRVSIATSICMLAGVFQLLLGLSGLGFISYYLSDAFISGYTCGSAIHVFVSQIKDIFGLKNTIKYEGVFKIPKIIYDLVLKMYTINWFTFACSIICLAFLLVFKEFLNKRIKSRFKFEFPVELLLIILLTIVSYFANFNSNFGISILNHIPSGFPSPILPDITLFRYMIKDTLLIATISISITISLASLFSRKQNYAIDSTQELYSLGAANVFSSLFGCFPCCASLSRSSLLESIGSKTPLNCLFSCSIVFLVIAWLGPLFESLPKLCLASIILVSLKGLLFQVKDFVQLAHVNHYEAITWIFTFVSTVLLDVDYGLFIGIGVSIFSIIVRDQCAQVKKLIPYENSAHFFDENMLVTGSRDNSVERVRRASSPTSTAHQVLIFKPEESIYFANCEIFKRNLVKSYGICPIEIFEKQTSEVPDEKETIESTNKTVQIESEIKNISSKRKNYPDIIMDFSAVNYVDTNGVNILMNIVEDFRKIGVSVYICQAQESFVRMLFKMNLLELLSEQMFLTVDEAYKHVTQRSLFSNELDNDLE